MIKTSAGRKAAMLAAAISASLAGTAPVAAIAQDGFPQPGRQLRIIVPFTAGGSSDVQARMLADRLSRLWGQPVVVENKPGAGGHLGGRYVADQPADGYTLMVGSIGLHAAYGVYGKLAYDPAKDLRVVTVLAEMPHVVVATPSLAASNLAELTALAKKAPGTVNFGSAGVGSSVHMMGELYKLQAGAPIVHVPYRGSSAAINDLLGGQIDFIFENVTPALPFVQSGKLKALAVTSEQRLPALPDVPTMKESGYPAFVTGTWNGVLAPKGTPTAIVKRLEEATLKVAGHADFKSKVTALGGEVRLLDSKAFREFTRAEYQRWNAIVQTAKLERQ